MMAYEDINEELENLMIKFEIDRYHPRFAKYKRARSLIREYLNGYKDKKIILVASSLTDSDYIREDCRYFITIKDIVLYEQIEAYPWEDIRDDIFIIIVSFYGRRKAASQLFRYGMKPLLVYDYLLENGLLLEGNYYDIFGEEYHTYKEGKATFDYASLDINAIFFYDRRNYEIAEDKLGREMYLARMIFDCVYVKDWELTEKYIKEYMALGGGSFRKYEIFLQKVKDLLASIKKKLIERQKNDIVIFWLDALEFGEDKDMPYLHSLSDKSVDFLNAYTVTPYTHSAAKALFDHKYVVDDKSYKMRITRKSKFIYDIEERGYTFSFYTILNQVDESLRGRICQNRYAPISEVCWNAISDILKSEKKICAVLHEVLSTHTPYVSFGLTGDEYFYIKESINILSGNEKAVRDRQALESRRHVDSVLQFYSNLLPEDFYKIYMSDHGHTELERFHTVFRIVHKDMIPQKVDGVFSYINFDKLVYNMLENNNDFSGVVGEYAKIQDVDYYFKNTIKLYLQEKSYPVNCLRGYTGIATSKYRYIRFSDGQEIYYNSEFNKPPMTEEDIAYLRQLCTEYPQDIIEDNQFQYTRNMYATHRNYMRRNGAWEAKKIRTLKTLFDDLPDSAKVALRGGGKHTWEMWFVLSRKAQKKIAYVIDSNPRCMAAKLGVEIIGIDDILSKGLDAIIISSYKNELAWYEELKNISNDIPVIRLYDYLEENGVHCSMEFYKEEYTKEDIVWVE